MTEPRRPPAEAPAGAQQRPSDGSHEAVVICVRPTCSELGEKLGTGLDDPFEDFCRSISGLVTTANGSLVGDGERELVCVFDSAATALRCTQSIQRMVAESDRQQWLGARIGCFGAAQTDPSSNAWQYALQCSRELANRAQPGQTIACASTLNGLDSALVDETLPLDADDWACDRTGIGMPLCLIRWQDDVPTRLANPVKRENIITRALRLHLRWREENLILEEQSPAVTIGRSSQADITIESQYASRVHADLKHFSAGFVLTDRSTNGTYVRIEDEAEVYLHEDELILRGEGCISLGRRPSAAKGKVVFFKTERARSADATPGARS